LRKLGRNFIYQPFVRPFKYLRRKPRSGGQRDADRAEQPLARWTVPRIAPEPRHDESRAAVSALDERAPQPSDTSLSGRAAE
jgi:hypothetical protein